MTGIKERPILFSAPMVRAILDGRKTQTRRALNPQPVGGIQYHPCAPFNTLNGNGDLLVCKWGKRGERLWVRETWQHSNYPFGPFDQNCEIFYRADYWDDPHGMDGEKSPEGKYRDWKPSIHMPRVASRINLEITGVRIERLQDISAQDANAEGIDGQTETGPWRNYLRDGYWFPEGKDSAPTCSYQSLWEAINGVGSWDKNPFVWVIEFQRIPACL